MKQLTIAITANREEVSYSVIDNDGNVWSDTMKTTAHGVLCGVNTEPLTWLPSQVAYVVEGILNEADELVGAILRMENEEVE